MSISKIRRCVATWCALPGECKPSAVSYRRRCLHRLIAQGPVETYKKSRFQATLFAIDSPCDVQPAIDEITRDKQVAKASHPAIRAFRCVDKRGSTVAVGRHDDGESGASMVLLRLLDGLNLKSNVLVCVTRWYGGFNIGGARFRLISKVANDLLFKCKGELITKLPDSKQNS